MSELLIGKPFVVAPEITGISIWYVPGLYCIKAKAVSFRCLDFPTFQFASNNNSPSSQIRPC